MCLSRAPPRLRSIRTNSLMNWLRGCLLLGANLESRTWPLLTKRSQWKRITFWWHPTNMRAKLSAIRIIIQAPPLLKTPTIPSTTRLLPRGLATSMIRHPISLSSRHTSYLSKGGWRVCPPPNLVGEMTRNTNTPRAEKGSDTSLVYRSARRTISYINDSLVT